MYLEDRIVVRSFITLSSAFQPIYELYVHSKQFNILVI